MNLQLINPRFKKGFGGKRVQMAARGQLIARVSTMQSIDLRNANR